MISINCMSYGTKYEFLLYQFCYKPWKFPTSISEFVCFLVQQIKEIFSRWYWSLFVVKLVWFSKHVRIICYRNRLASFLWLVSVNTICVSLAIIGIYYPFICICMCNHSMRKYTEKQFLLFWIILFFLSTSSLNYSD